MSSITGIEVAPDSCALVGVRPAGRLTAVFALQVVEPGADSGMSLAERFAAGHGPRRFPRRARAVVWGTDSVSLDDPMTAERLQPFISAGFRIESACTPAEALVCLAASRRRPETESAVAWLSINMHGAAIAIVRETELLYSQTLAWSYVQSRSGSTAQLLQRYSLVAHLAPELQRGIEVVRGTHECPVETAITCGDLPDLRSLTMPLIEELDLEVETLDSVEGLQVAGSARRERFAEEAPALRLAIAAALGRPGAARTSIGERARRAAAVLAAAAALIWLAYALREPAGGARPSPPAVTAAAPQPQAASPKQAKAETRQPPPAPAAAPPDRQAALPPPPAPALPAEGASRPPLPKPAADRVITPKPGPVESPVRTVEGARSTPRPPQSTNRQTERPVGPLATPVPRLDSILVDGDRRLAIVDGQILAIGETRGGRTLVRIDPDAVVLREPSGLEVRLTIRSRRGRSHANY